MARKVGVRSVEPLEATKVQLEKHFKSIGQRKVVFHEQKLRNHDRQFELARKQHRQELATDVAKAADEAACPSRSRAHAAGDDGERDDDGRRISRSQSSPLLDFGPGGRGSGLQDSNRWTPSVAFGHEAWNIGPAPRTPGMSCGRFAAQHPVAAHPAVHPGAIDKRHSMTSFRPPSPHVPGGRRASSSIRTGGSVSSISAPPTSRGLLHGRGRAPPTSFMTEVGEMTDEDRFIAAMDAEETMVMMPTHSAELSETLGGLIGLLGPRYKTMSRDKLWQKAETLQLTPFQRRMRREQERLGIAGTSKASLLPQEGSQGRRKPEDAPDNDPDGQARKFWLRARRLERRALEAPVSVS